jgi:tetratricopeptide (TPR) repeat protein
LLAGALGLTGPAWELFVAAARGKAPAAEVLEARIGVAPGSSVTATRALPRDIARFTGRQAELTQLLGATDGAIVSGGVVRIHAIGGMAGVGKTTFAVHAAHLVAGNFPDGQFFMPLHAHTAGQRPVDPVDALASLLLSAGVAAAQIPPGLDARAARWRDLTAGRKILLLLEDAAGYEQIRSLLPGTAGSVVLVTSRRRLTALEDALVISLDTLSPGEAAEPLARLAGRPDLTSADAAVAELTRLCGHLPLAIGMLASQLRHRPVWTVAALAAELAASRDRLAVMHTENLSVAAAFGLSYAELTPGPQRLFRQLGLVPGPDFDAYAAAAVDGTSLDTTRGHLGELYDQHLLTEASLGRYQLHDLLREYARALAAADAIAESDAAVSRLLDYYLHTVLAAGRHIATRDAVREHSPPGQPPADAPDLSTFGQAAAWLEAEHANLHAAAEYAAESGRALHAMQIPAAMGGFLRRAGRWDQAVALQSTALTAARDVGDRYGEAKALNELGLLAWLTGNCPAAAARLALAGALYEEAGDRLGQAYALNHLGVVQVLTGDYPAALTSHQRALAIAKDVGDRPAVSGSISW